MRLPPGAKGNIFRLPDGNVLVTVVTLDRSVDGEAFDLDLPLTLRLRDAAEFRAAYFLSPDLLGKRRLAVERQGTAMHVVLPRHRSASAVLLAKTGVHAAMEGPWELVVTRPAETNITIDNLTGKAVDVELLLPGGKPQPIHVSPGASAHRAVTIPAPPLQQGPRASIPVGLTIDGRNGGGDFEFYVDPPLRVTMRRLEGVVCQGRPAAACVDLFCAAAARAVRVDLSGDGLRVEPATLTISMASRTMRSLRFRVIPTRAGKLSLAASASSGNDRSRAQQALDVFAAAASPATLEQIRSGVLLFDVFGSDGGPYKNKPVLVNGVEIGLVPQQGDSWGSAEIG